MNNHPEISAEVLRNILCERSMQLTVADVYQIMDEELERPEDEMDTELVDICSEALCRHFGLNLDEKPPIYKPWEDPKYAAHETCCIEAETK